MKKFITCICGQHILQILVYGIVGACAWVTQTIVYTAFISIKCSPVWSMALGTFMGMIVAYFGHVRFTFKKSHRFSHKEFIKFAVTSIIGLFINILGVWVITRVLVLHPGYAIIPTIFTPIVTYLISKFWAFR